MVSLIFKATRFGMTRVHIWCNTAFANNLIFLFPLLKHQGFLHVFKVHNLFVRERFVLTVIWHQITHSRLHLFLKFVVVVNRNIKSYIKATVWPFCKYFVRTFKTKWCNKRLNSLHEEMWVSLWSLPMGGAEYSKTLHASTLVMGSSAFFMETVLLARLP